MTIFNIEWHKNKKSLLVWSISLAVIIIGFMSIFPSMENSAMNEMMTTKLDALPESMLKAFHLNSGPSLAEVTGFFAYVFQYLFIASSMYAIILGNKMLVKEETEGTIEFLYAQPVSRKQIVMEKLLASVSILSCFWLITYVSSLGITLFVNKGKLATNDVMSALSKVFVTEFFVLVFFLALGFVLSSLIKRANLGLGMGIVFIFYLLGIVGDLKEELSFLKDISPMAQAGPAALLEADFNWGLVIILFLVSALLVGATLFIYERKDLDI